MAYALSSESYCVAILVVNPGPLKVGRCRLTVSKPVLKAPVVSALETIT